MIMTEWHGWRQMWPVPVPLQPGLSQGLTSSSEIVWRSMTSKAALSLVAQQSVPHGPEC